MRAAMLLIVLLAASFSAHADKSHLTTSEIWGSTDGGYTWADPAPCEMGVILDSNGTLIIDSNETQSYALEQLDCSDNGDGGDLCEYIGRDQYGEHYIRIIVYDYCWYIYITMDENTIVAYRGYFHG